jgi:RimJ/RimL family protein N-acetyltransferase
MAMPHELGAWRGAEPPASVTLEGHFVRLEPLSAAKHATPIWHAVQGRDEVWDYLFDGPYAREDDFRQAIAAKEAVTDARFYAIVPLTGSNAGEAAGYASLMRIDTRHGVIEVGNVLFAPRLQRTPAATEAMFLMARYIFDVLGYRRYEWKCNALNEPSRRAADRLGFLYEGTFRQHMVIKGRNRDTAWFAMTDHDWPSRKAAFDAWLDPQNFAEGGRQVRSLKQLRRDA